MRAELARAQAEASDWRIRHDELAQAFSAVTGSARYVTLPADQFDKLMSEVDAADPAPKLAEAAVKPRAFSQNPPSSIGVPIRALCGCEGPDFLLHDSGLIECATCLVDLRDPETIPERSGNSGIPCGTETSNFLNIEESA
ncbi:hypothetical protein [Nocardia rhizosphaerae]|uniref:Uncharacterized protein n=1 Tax=Nocardia rhizosphaerae TaxID=1691571 RepID=A0ABV8LEP5_9NOCA